MKKCGIQDFESLLYIVYQYFVSKSAKVGANLRLLFYFSIKFDRKFDKSFQFEHFKPKFISDKKFLYKAYFAFFFKCNFGKIN